MDNSAAGGLTAGVDVATGTLRRALAPHCSSDARTQWAWVDTHPDTGALGSQAWRSATGRQWWQGSCARLAAMPESRYVAWDVAITRDGFSIIEGNSRADVIFQGHGPLLLDERVRKVFAASTADAPGSARGRAGS